MGKGGLNCCIPGCTNYYEKTKGKKISYVGFPKKHCGKDDWRRKLIVAVRRADDGFNADTAKICSAHFDPTCLLFHGQGFKLAKDSLPTLAMPKRSIETPQTVSRKAPMQRPLPQVPMRVAFLAFSELLGAATKLATPWVVLCSTSDTLIIGKTDCNADIEVKVVFSGSFIPRVTYKGSEVKRQFDVEVCGLSRLCKDLEDISWCPGSVPRSKLCPVAVESHGYCRHCETVRKSQTAKESKTLSTHAPLSSASRPALIQEVRSVRSKLKDREARLQSIKSKLAAESVSVSDETEEGLSEVLENSQIDDPFLQLFWEEQKKAANRDPRGMRWHPMMIRFAIYLHYQSPRAYEALRSTGVLHLPNKSTLRDYTSFFKPQEGFQAHVFKDIRSFAKDLPPEKKYVALLHDEMTVRGDLVYEHRGGEIVGFINPQTWNFKKDNETMMASQVLVFMAKGINNNLQQSLGYFATQTATSDMLFPLMWEAVAYLEQQGLKVISSTSDKASPNQKLYRLHGDGIVHQTMNAYAIDDDQPLFFISDPPHLIKTIRNNLESSRFGGTRCLWNNGKHLLWSHIFQLYSDDHTGQLQMSRLTERHINLKPSSRMSVNLAAQVLSQTVGKLLQRYYSLEASETSAFVLMCDEFFDCLNARSFTEHIWKRKPALAPYRDIVDPRFQFLERFLEYLHQWKANIQARQGFSKAEKDRMFLSQQTNEGIVTTVNGFIGATKYLLSHGVPYVLSNDFCQDPLEEHFGRHRGLGMRSRNPSVYEFGHQENKLRMQRTLAFCFQPKGNTTARPRENQQVHVEEAPLPKIKRH